MLIPTPSTACLLPVTGKQPSLHQVACEIIMRYRRNLDPLYFSDLPDQLWGPQHAPREKIFNQFFPPMQQFSYFTWMLPCISFGSSIRASTSLTSGLVQLKFTIIYIPQVGGFLKQSEGSRKVTCWLLEAPDGPLIIIRTWLWMHPCTNLLYLLFIYTRTLTLVH